MRCLRSDISEIARNSEELGQKLDSLADSYEFGNALLKKSYNVNRTARKGLKQNTGIKGLRVL